MPVYQFLKEPLIRKYGEAFCEAPDAAAKALYAKGEGIKDKAVFTAKRSCGAPLQDRFSIPGNQECPG